MAGIGGILGAIFSTGDFWAALLPLTGAGIGGLFAWWERRKAKHADELYQRTFDLLRDKSAEDFKNVRDAIALLGACDALVKELSPSRYLLAILAIGLPLGLLTGINFELLRDMASAPIEGFQRADVYDPILTFLGALVSAVGGRQLATRLPGLRLQLGASHERPDAETESEATAAPIVRYSSLRAEISQKLVARLTQLVLEGQELRAVVTPVPDQDPARHWLG